MTPIVKKITEHQAQVRKLMNLIIADCWVRYLDHDSSKLREPEYSIFERHFGQLQAAEYGTPDYDAALGDVKEAITHHYQANRHHPEHFANGINGMTLIDLCEMLCDWMVAISYGPNGSLAKSIKINTQRFGISSQLVQILENTACWLRDNAASGQIRPAPDDQGGDSHAEKNDSSTG